MAAAQDRVSAFIDAFNRMDIDGACDMLAEDVVYHNIPMEPVHGRETARAFLTGMPNLTGIEWEVFNSAENGDTVLNEREDRFFFHDRKDGGQHAGKDAEKDDGKDDGTKIVVRVMGVFKVRNDEIVEWRDYFDLAEFQAQQ